MKNVISSPLFSATSRVAATLATAMPSGVLAATDQAPIGTDCDPSTGGAAANPLSNGAQCATSGSQANSLFGANGIFHTISNVLIFLIGAIAVIMLIYGGFRYVVSGGNKDAVNGAKNTILYAVIGIVVAILAYAIVGFVTGSLAPSGGTSNP